MTLTTFLQNLKYVAPKGTLHCTFKGHDHKRQYKQNNVSPLQMWAGAKYLVQFSQKVKCDCGNSLCITNILLQPCYFSFLPGSFFLWSVATRVSLVPKDSAVLYQVHYWAILLHQKSLTYETGCEIQMSKCISFTIMHFDKMFWGHNIVCARNYVKNCFILINL